MMLDFGLCFLSSCYCYGRQSSKQCDTAYASHAAQFHRFPPQILKMRLANAEPRPGAPGLAKRLAGLHATVNRSFAELHLKKKVSALHGVKG
jgi:hypothetical protein